MFYTKRVVLLVVFSSIGFVSCSLPRDNSLDKNSPYYVACSTTPPSGASVVGVTRNSVSLSWAAVSNAKGYFVIYRIVGVTSWYTMTVYTNAAEISSLLANTNYELKIQTYCEGGYLYVNNFNSSNSTTINFRTSQY